MRWRDWQQEISDCDIIIYYNDSELYPITEWLHPGTLPIGTGLHDDIRQDLPNLDWLIRHAAWMGFQKITVVSHEPFKGLDLFYKDFMNGLDIKFTNEHISEVLKSKITKGSNQLILLSGLIHTNANLRHAFMLHKQRENLISLLSIRGLQFRVGLADLSGDDVKSFREKPLDKTLLVNSNIIIIDAKSLVDDKELHSKLISRIDGHGYSIEEIIRHTINFFISEELMKSVELTGVSDDPWFLDLSQLENWVKLDHDQFIEMFSHLYTIE